MLLAFAALAAAAFIGVSLYGSVRLALLWRRTRQLPELLIAVTLFDAGPLGMGLAAAAVRAGEPLASCLRYANYVSVSVGTLAICLFVREVFRRESRAAALATAAALALSGVLLALTLARWLRGENLTDPTIALEFCTLSGAAFLWLGVEAFGWWTMLRRRVALGLADPLVANRFFLWSLVSLFSCLTTVFGAVGAALSGGAMLSPMMALVLSLLALPSSASLYLAFAPPAAYRAWVQRRAAAGARG